MYLYQLIGFSKQLYNIETIINLILQVNKKRHIFAYLVQIHTETDGIKHRRLDPESLLLITTICIREKQGTQL